MGFELRRDSDGGYRMFPKKPGCIKLILAFLFPPLAVVDKGCGSFLITLLLTCCGWIPGVIATLIILKKE